MNFYKIFKALNSAQSSWQVSLAITLGMLSGFLPMFTIANIVILILVFSINVPFAIFVLSSVLFGSLAFILDPYFASIGYDILTNPSFNTIFTNMYNYAPTLWSSYNHTAVMGSFIFGLISFIPTYIIFKILINKYRIQFQKWFETSKYFSWLNPFSEKKLSKKPGIFRISGFLFIVSFISLIIAFVVLVFDPILKFTLEFTLNKLSSKTIYIDDVTSDFQKGILDINSIIVKSDKQSDDSKIDKIRFDFNTRALLHKKANITQLTFKNIILNTTQDVQNKTTSEQLVSKLIENKNSKEMKLPKVDDILKKENLQTINQAKIIQKDINEILTRYKTYSKSDINESQLKDLKTRIIALKNQITNIKDKNDIPNILKNSKSVQEDINTYKNKLSNLNEKYKVDKQLLSKHYETINTLPKKEYDYIINKYSLDQRGALNFLGTYFSASLQKYITLGLKYYKLAKPYLNTKEEDIEQKRMSGRYIHFSDKLNLPSFVIHNLNANIKIKELEAKLHAINISNDPKKLNKIISAKITSSNVHYKNSYLNLTHDGLKDKQLTFLDMNIKELKNEKYDTKNNLVLLNSIISSKARVDIVDFKTIKANINNNILKTTFDYSSSGSKFDSLLKNILKDINKFNINAKIVGDLQDPSISINSNLDKIIAKQLKQVANKKLLKFKNELKEKLTKKFKDELGTNMSKDDFNKVEKLLSTYNTDQSIFSNFQNITSSSLLDDLKNKKINSEKEKAKDKISNKAKEQLQNKLKSLF